MLLGSKGTGVSMSSLARQLKISTVAVSEFILREKKVEKYNTSPNFDTLTGKDYDVVKKGRFLTSGKYNIPSNGKLFAYDTFPGLKVLKINSLKEC